MKAHVNIVADFPHHEVIYETLVPTVDGQKVLRLSTAQLLDLHYALGEYVMLRPRASQPSLTDHTD